METNDSMPSVNLATEPTSVQLGALRSLFPHLGESDLNEVAETLRGYCAIAWRVYERLKRECPEVIDELMRTRRMKAKVDSSPQNQTT